jgi:CHAD domain-containing protein
MADGKWITDLEPDLPLEQAAKKVLGIRLRVVREALPRAVFEADQDIEHVHQLRVATRRADAALRIFRTRLPGRVYKTAREHLRAIRRAAGAARDWDVFLLALAARHAEVKVSDGDLKELPGLDFLIGHALGQRLASQAHLAAVEQAEGERFSGLVHLTVESVRVPHDEKGDRPLLALAGPLLAEVLHNLKRAAAGDLKDYNHLHQVRIVGKRLRYAMEVFASCCLPAFKEEYYPRVEAMQEILGRANDSHVAGQRLAGLRDALKVRLPDLWERLRPGIEGLLRFHHRRLPQERRKFVKWWEGWTTDKVEEGVLGSLSGVGAVAAEK